MRVPLLPVQILWINLVTHGFPALAVVVDPTSPDLMQRPPRSPHAPFLSLRQLLVLSGQGFFMAVAALAAFLFFLYGAEQNLPKARTAACTVLVSAQLTRAFNCRSARRSLFSSGVGANAMLLWAVVGSVMLQVTILLLPWTQAVFGLAPLAPDDWFVIGALRIAPLPAVEIWKALVRWRESSRSITIRTNGNL